MNTTQQTDILIIGGGLAGLTTAYDLVQSGLHVALYEKSAELGGRANTDVFDGFAFNRGIHALYCGGAAEKMLKDWNIAYTGRSPSGIQILSEGVLHTAPVGIMSLIGTGGLSAADKFELLRVFATLPQVDAHAARHMSVQAWIEKNAQRPHVRQFLAANARTFVYSAALDLVSAEVFIQKTQLAFKHPVLYIDGGWQTLVTGLRHKAEAAGVQIITGARVESVVADQGHIQGIRLADGRLIEARAVIVATTPQEAAKLIPGTIYPALSQIVSDLMPAQLACLDVALKQLPNPHAGIVQDIDHPRFLSTQSLFSQVAPNGGTLMYSFKQLDPTHPSDPQQDEKELEDFLDTVQSGWRQQVVKRRYLPRIQAIGTLPLAKHGGFAGRPNPFVPGIENLYLVGDWIGSEGFLADASIASARLVAHSIRQMSSHMMTV